jgi:hypothetical protein
LQIFNQILLNEVKSLREVKASKLKEDNDDSKEELARRDDRIKGCIIIINPFLAKLRVQKRIYMK